MVGVPKSNRCTFCKSRKTKCDENWPRCGACARANRVCSGARSNYKFVVNGSHNELPSSSADDHGNARRHGGKSKAEDTAGGSKEPKWTLVHLREYTKGECSYHRMRIAQTKARPSEALSWPIVRPTDRLAVQLIQCLNSVPEKGLTILGSSLRMIPKQLESGSMALQSAVQLIVASWTNSRRDLHPGHWLDLKIYSNALRSLQDAVDGLSQESVTDTLAAQCILQKVEVVYDFERGSNRENHAAGLTAVVSKGGASQAFTELGLHVTFEGFFYMLQEDVRLDRESALANSEWARALRREIENVTMKPALRHMYRLWVEMAVWPTLVHLVRLVRQCPSDSMTAAELLLRATPAHTYLLNDEDAALARMFESGEIREVEDPSAPDWLPTRYEFLDFDTANYFCFHASFGIIVCRALQAANSVLGQDNESLTARARKLSKRIWMSHAWMKDRLPLSVEFTAALAFSYESGTEKEREFCIRAFEEMESFRQPPPIGKWVEATIMANAKAYTGRLPFRKTQDVTIEYQGLGCRS